MQRAKNACKKPVGGRVWYFDRVRSHWDRLQLRSWNEGLPYQEGELASLLPPDEIISFARTAIQGGLDGGVLFCGTVPLKTPGFMFGKEFRARLFDPVRATDLELRYSVVGSQGYSAGQ